MSHADSSTPRRAAIGVSLLGAMGVAASLAGLGLSRAATPESDARNIIELWPYWIASAVSWAALTMLWWSLRHEAGGAAARATSTGRRAAWLIVAFALALRLVVIAFHEPGLSDDVWRFVFDGRVVASGHSPYVVPPLEIDPGWPRISGEAELATRVNHPYLVSVYLPTSQYVFAATALATPTAAPDEAARAVRLAFVVFELAAIAMLFPMLRRRGLSPWYAALYAWHPLALSEVAGSGHQDAIGLPLMLLALHLASVAPGRTIQWTIPLAASAMVKPVVVPLAAFALRGRPWREWLASLATGAVVVAALSAPLLAPQFPEAVHRLAETYDRFVGSWVFFGSAYPIVAAMTGSGSAARWVCAALLALVFAALLAWRRDPVRAARDFLLAALLLSTTAYPWYLLWALVLFPVAPSPALWVASLTLPWGYAVLGDVAGWTVPPWLPWLTYGPVYAAMLAAPAWRSSRASTDA